MTSSTPRRDNEIAEVAAGAIRGYVFGGAGLLFLVIGLVLLCGAWAMTRELAWEWQTDAAATQAVDGQIVQRYWRTAPLVLPANMAFEHHHWFSRYTYQAVVVVAYTLAGEPLRAQFADPGGAREMPYWPPESFFDRDLPMQRLSVSLPNSEAAHLRTVQSERRDRGAPDKKLNGYQELLLDLDDPVLATVESWRRPDSMTIPLRVDPAHPDRPLLAAQSSADSQARFRRNFAIGATVVVGLFGLLALLAACRTLLGGWLGRWTVAVWLLIVAMLPWWSSQVPRIVDWFNADAAALFTVTNMAGISASNVLGVAHAAPPDDAANVIAVAPADSMYRDVWSLFALQRPAHCCRTRVAAYRELQTQLTQQTLALDDAKLTDTLQHLSELADSGHRRLLPPLIPALDRVSRDPQRSDGIRRLAVHVLRAAVDYPVLPRDLKNAWYEDLRPLQQHPSSAIAEHARSHVAFHDRK